jgi:hypothetical protein
MCVVDPSSVPDLVVFGAPFLLALGAYYFVFRRVGNLPFVLALGLAVCVAVLSSFASVWLPFNTYGT